MIEVFIEAEAGSREKAVYDDQTLTYKYTRTVNQPYPYPYGFVRGTRSSDGGAVDCYLITTDPIEAGTAIECEPIGVLEQWEDEEIDNKVLAILPGQTAVIDRRLLDELREFIYRVFRAFPDTTVRVGDFLSKKKAIEYIEERKL